MGATGDLDITGDLTITGVGARNTILDGADLDRVFDIDPGGAGISVTIGSVTIRNGSVTGSTGGGVQARGGTLTLFDCWISSNEATVNGGGIFNSGTLVINCRVFCDRYMMTNPASRAFVKWYYRTSPPVADFIRRHEWARAVSRIALTPMTAFARWLLRDTRAE